ncbi:hypothetical protein [Paraburkholderia dinghuensis]|uniref:Uncharacterized protein n=1 Tax=Paraburkholderia dinghuensis TaxID=2305225 RepID=A0A3N6PR20_9BURK|nr:hypothetical protein [Paraburkholderia dinghuensis]RQH04350.1 hypothetical protein D1Y85_17935 [Paraburkholderia dinghuensis]
MAITLTHETSPAIARSIIETRVFIGGPILGDAGMNACIEGVAYNADQAERRGALIEFEWSGPIQSAPADGRHEPGVLYDERPHRAFIFVCTREHLRVTGVRFRNGISWRHAVRVPPRPAGSGLWSAAAWLAWARASAPRWLDRQAEDLERAIQERLASEPTVSVEPPASCPYLFILRNRGLI